ncbi:hypothetical protein RF11_11940 [Thelohanellus kitauei]|uniref:Uncharacterized protein n=1 Tax=Thelohanellus kitauei TaxID=669202 RepID=A0A0C2IL36_THEKT|nr:hypothetical protein RF11_11940 [Thelohanellus kitauei]
MSKFSIEISDKTVKVGTFYGCRAPEVSSIDIPGFAFNVSHLRPQYCSSKLFKNMRSNESFLDQHVSSQYRQIRLSAQPRDRSKNANLTGVTQLCDYQMHPYHTRRYNK